ncbi:alginate O-acetyltransferase AlgX-related protein [Fluviicola sp.]|uniref:alginate O-acetyltransferase AlgX-related protein n=1 Tax=Fluviicola sp. TaxID=1917219 RepID=UPI003D2AF470
MDQQPTYKRLKQVVFAGIIALLFIPMIQHKFRFLEEKPLNGSYELSSKPALNKANWFSGKYQEGQDKYIQEHTGFRPGWVRLYNQWNFSLFRKASANGVIVGKENFLYEENYIKAYYGTDFLGDEKIEEISIKWKAIQDTLKRKGIDLVVIFAPGKGSFYPEYIPDRYKKRRKGKINYEVFKKQFNKQDVSYIDMHSWFESMKKDSRYPLFPRTGIHWSSYGQFLAADSITKLVSKRCNQEIPHFILDRIELPDSTLLDDDDIEKGMNIFRDIPDFQLAYPKFHPNRTQKKNDPKVLMIADSFYWGLFNANVSHFLFNDGEFWYYNEQIYPAIYQRNFGEKSAFG